MLRTAISSKSYDVTVTIAGEQTKMKFRSLSLMERLEFMGKVAVGTVTADGLKQLATDLEQLIISIEGYDEKPSEVLCRLEHSKDVDDLLKCIIEWCHLPEQEAKNLDSLPVQSTPAPVEGNVEIPAGADEELVSTSSTDSEQTEA